MTKPVYELERLWALAEPAFEHEFSGAADTLEAFMAAGLLSETDAMQLRARFDRMLADSLRWPPPRPDVRARALDHLRGLADQSGLDAQMIARYLAEMNLITSADVRRLDARIYPEETESEEPPPEVLAVAVEQPVQRGGIDVIWIMRSKERLTIRWELDGVELDFGDPRAGPSNLLDDFVLETAGGQWPSAGGEFRGAGDAATGVAEFAPPPPPGPATLRFGEHERSVTLP